ncbi:basic proline-rich protein-like [Manis pentadactyla]|uniref:basic proline-rich protein-like n=1 Tax=Manis pentadactyla TaxID=143292 RepID=UPI00255CD86A|nr:basic proline-rich protein-like [Manis pentadactyla]
MARASAAPAAPSPILPHPPDLAPPRAARRSLAAPHPSRPGRPPPPPAPALPAAGPFLPHTPPPPPPGARRTSRPCGRAFARLPGPGSAGELRLGLGRTRPAARVGRPSCLAQEPRGQDGCTARASFEFAEWRGPP